MKIVRTIAFIILMSTVLDHGCVASEMEVDTHGDFSNTEQIVWPRVKIKFNREKFLRDCAREFPESCAKTLNNQQNDEGALNDLCWKVLFELKDHYKPIDEANYIFTYQSMAKFLLAYAVFPRAYSSITQKKEFLTSLIDKIGSNITPQCKHGGKLKKWFHIYESFLFIEYAKKYTKEGRKNTHLANAFHEIKQSIQLKTTRTAYLVAAEIILDHGYIPPDMTVGGAVDLAKTYIELAYQAEQKTSLEARPPHKEPRLKTTVEIHAQPPYLKDLDLKDLGKKPDEETQAQSMVAPGEQHLETEDDFFWIPENEDDLTRFEFDSLIVPQKLDIIGLPVRNHVLNPAHNLQETYPIDGKQLRRQNVSGNGMRCLFNAMGLDPESQITQLAFLANDPILRLMIANEIVSASATPHEIPEALKEAVNYGLYEVQRAELDRLEKERSALLASQTTDPNRQNVHLLPEVYQTTQQRGADYLQELRKRSLTLKAYNAFLQCHMGGNEMMVALQDVSQNGNGNFTSIDALGYANNIGLKILQPSNGNLNLVHQYIPENAKEISYIFHKDHHFQALVPVEEEMVEEENDDMSLGLEPEGSSDQTFINGLQEVLETEGLSLENEADYDLFSSDQSIRSLIDTCYGEGINIKIWLDRNEEPIVMESWDEEAETIHFSYSKGKLERIKEPSKEQAPPKSSFEERFPSAEELISLYPEVITQAHKTSHDPNVVRKILYATQTLNWKPKTISSEVQIDSRRISDILVSNGARRNFYIPQEEQENLLEAYLKYYHDIKDETLPLRELARGFSATRPDIPPKSYITLIHKLVQKDKSVDVDQETSKRVTQKYLNGKNLFAIQTNSNLNFATILKILSENVNPSDFRFKEDLQLKKQKLSEKEKEDLIVAKFWELKRQYNKDPGVDNVRKSLIEDKHNIGYKPIERILKSKGLIKDKIKARHISLETRKAICDEFNTINCAKRGKRKKETYKALAKKYEVSVIQVTDLITKGTYEATSIKRSEANYDRVVAAYRTLDDEQKKLPARHISQVVPLAHSTINQILSKAGLYEWNGKTGKHAGNALMQEGRVTS